MYNKMNSNSGNGSTTRSLGHRQQRYRLDLGSRFLSYDGKISSPKNVNQTKMVDTRNRWAQKRPLDCCKFLPFIPKQLQ